MFPHHIFLTPWPHIQFTMTTFIRKEDFIDLNANLMHEQMIERITDHKKRTFSNAGEKNE